MRTRSAHHHNFVAKAHVPFGQHQGTGLGADQKTRGLWEWDCFTQAMFWARAGVDIDAINYATKYTTKIKAKFSYCDQSKFNELGPGCSKAS